jgi:hypothetical protein
MVMAKVIMEIQKLGVNHVLPLAVDVRAFTAFGST